MLCSASWPWPQGLPSKVKGFLLWISDRLLKQFIFTFYSSRSIFCKNDVTCTVSFSNTQHFWISNRLGTFRVSLTSWGRAIRLDGWSLLHPLVVLRCVAGIRKESRLIPETVGGRIQRITHLWSLITELPLKLQAMRPCEIIHIMICFWLSICLGITIKWDHITYAHYLCPPGSSKTSKWRWSKSRQTVVFGRKNSSVKLLGLISSNWELIEVAVAIDFFMHFSWPFGKH